MKTFNSSLIDRVSMEELEYLAQSGIELNPSDRARLVQWQREQQLSKESNSGQVPFIQHVSGRH